MKKEQTKINQKKISELNVVFETIKTPKNKVKKTIENNEEIFRFGSPF